MDDRTQPIDDSKLLEWRRRRKELLISEGLLPPDDDTRPSLPLRQALRELPQQYLTLLKHPKVSEFYHELDKAAWNNVIVQLSGLALLCALMIAVGELVYPSRSISTTFIILYPVIIFIGVIAAFFMIEGLIYLFAWLFRGEGTFLRQCYASLLAYVPLIIAVSFCMVIPVFGPVIVLGILLYCIRPRYVSLRAVHDLDEGKTILCFVLPLIILGLFSCCLGSLFIHYVLPVT